MQVVMQLWLEAQLNLQQPEPKQQQQQQFTQQQHLMTRSWSRTVCSY
jgi:hypothetical protein